MIPRPPRIARAILAFATEPADRPWLMADIDEEFAQRAQHDVGSARRWYWLQTGTSLIPLVRRRLRRRPPTLVPARPELLNGLGGDVRHALRIAARTPVPTAAVLLTMALGIGAAAAVSTVVWKVLLQPLPVPEPERVLALYRIAERSGLSIPSVSYPDLLDWRQRSQTLAGVAGYTGSEGTLLKDEGPVPVNVATITADFFGVLGSRFALGRPFNAEHFLEGAAPAVILSSQLWQRDFAGDSTIVGRSIELASGRAVVVGVVARDEFTLPLGGADLWAPLHVPTSGPNAWMSSRGSQWVQAIARVRSNQSVEAAIAELRALDAAVQQEFPRPSSDPTMMGVMQLQQYIAGPLRTMLVILAAAIGIVLIVVCTNIANLRLVQAHARQSEFAMRLVLGARFSRLRRLVVTESILLAGTGGILGLLLAHPILRGLLALYPGGLPRADQIQLDRVVTSWSLVVAIVAGLLFALPQILQLVRLDPGRVAKSSERGVASRGHRAARNSMVVVQLALSVVMLVSSGLLVRTFLQVMRVSPGYDASGVLSFSVAAPASRYPTQEAAENLFTTLAERIGALPGVRSVGATNALPLTFNPWRNSVQLPNADANTPRVPVNVRLVSPEYLDLLHVPLTRGRSLDATDQRSTPAVAVINERLARVLYGDTDPIGQQLPVDGPIPRLIVGVVGDIHHTGLTLPADDEVYIPFKQAGVRRSRVMAVRVAGDPARLSAAVEREIRAVDPQLPIRSMRSLEEIVATSIAPQRFRAVFLGSLALLALALAIVGVYGVMSYAVSERARELGIRIALGESPAQIRGRVLREGLRLAVFGSALGGAGAWLAARAVRSLMFEVEPGDPLTLAIVAAVLTLVTILAADGPARRAGRVDPVRVIARN